MANPQRENGHVDIANEIMDKLCRHRIPGEVRQVMDTVFRKTYGWNKKTDRISLSQFSSATGLHKPNVVRALSRAIKHRIISNDNGWYQIQKDTDLWIPFSDRGNGDIKIDKAVIKNDKETLSVAIPTITSKTTDKRGGIYTEILEHWNRMGIQVHRRLTDDARGAIRSRLKDYSRDELLQAISNYAEIVNGPAYYWNHRWTLKDFLKRGVERFLDGDIARQNYRIRGNGYAKAGVSRKFQTPEERDRERGIC